MIPNLHSGCCFYLYSEELLEFWWRLHWFCRLLLVRVILMISTLPTHEHTRSFYLPELSSIIFQCSSTFPVEIVYFPARLTPRHFSFTCFLKLLWIGLLSWGLSHGVCHWHTGKVLFSTGFVFSYFAECLPVLRGLTSSHFSKDLLNSVAPTLATVSEHTQVEGSGSISYEGSLTREHCTRLCSFQGRTHTTFLPFYSSTVTVMAFLWSDGNTVN